MKKIIVLGAAGMAGHVIYKYLKEKEDVVATPVISMRSAPFELSYSVDAFKIETIEEVIKEKKPDVVINCIGLLVEDSKNRPDMAAYINGYLPHKLAQYGKEYGFKLIHLSTDCVFSGSKGSYTENSTKDETNPYGLSKSLGEVNCGNNLTIRTSIIGPEIKSDGTGLLQWFLKQNGKINGYANAFWNGITTLELAKFIYANINTDIKGLIHIHCKHPVSKYKLLLMFKEIYNQDVEIGEISLPNTIDKTVVKTRQDFSYEEKCIKDQISELKEWYSK